MTKKYTKEDFLNHFANIWEYEFKKTTQGNYKRFDLQFGNEYLDTDNIDNYLTLYLDLLDNEDFEMVNNVDIEEYLQMLKETIGANNKINVLSEFTKDMKANTKWEISKITGKPIIKNRKYIPIKEMNNEEMN